MLYFLTTLSDKFDTIGVSKTAAVLVLEYFMSGDSRYVLTKYVDIVEVNFDGASPET